MMSETYCDRTIREGVVGLIIPQEAELAAVLQTPTAHHLLDRGAGLYMLSNGSTILALDKPPGAFAKAVCVRDLLREAA